MNAQTETKATETETCTITIAEVGDLYLKYSGQSQQQDCYVQLDCESETLSAEVDTAIGPGTPFRVWHGRTIRWRIPALTESAAEGLLLDLIPLAERICAGYSCEWDGSNNVGRYSEDAREAAEAVRDLCDRDWSEGEKLSVWDAHDWYGSCGTRAMLAQQVGLTAETTDAELDSIVESEETAASPHQIDGIWALLRNLREDLRAEAD